MDPFRVHTGRVAPLHRANIDTDQIIPKQFLKRIDAPALENFSSSIGAALKTARPILRSL